MDTQEIIQLLNKTDVKSQLDGIKEADKCINTELYTAIKNLCSHYKVNEMVKVAGQKILKKYDPDTLNAPSETSDHSDFEDNETSEIKFGDSSSDGMSEKMSDIDSDAAGKMLKIVLGITAAGIFIAVIVCGLLFYKPWSLLNKADKSYAAKKWVMAVSEYNAVIDHNNRSSSFIINDRLDDIYANLIDACIQKKDMDALANACFKMMEQFPDNYEYAFRAAEILEENKLVDDALEIYDIIKNEAPEETAAEAQKHCERLSSQKLGQNEKEEYNQFEGSF